MSDSLPPAPPSGEAYGAPGSVAGRFNPLSIAALVVGIVGVLGTFYGIVALVSLVLGIVARRQIVARGERGRGMALAGIILGIIGIVFGILSIIGLSIVSGMHR